MSTHTVHLTSDAALAMPAGLHDRPKSDSGNVLTDSSVATSDLFASPPPSQRPQAIASATHSTSSAVHRETGPVTALVAPIATHALALHEPTSPLRALAVAEASHWASPSYAYTTTPFTHPLAAPQDAARQPSVTAVTAVVDGGEPAVLPSSRATSSWTAASAIQCDNPLHAFATAPRSPAEAEFVSTVAALTCLPPGYRFSPKRHSTTSDTVNAEHRKTLSGVSVSTQRGANNARPQHRVGQRFDSYDFVPETTSSSSPSPPLIHTSAYLTAETTATTTTTTTSGAAARRTVSGRYGSDTTRAAAMVRRANSTLSSSFASTATRGSVTTERGAGVAAHVSPHRLAARGAAELGRCYSSVNSSAGCRVASGTTYAHWTHLAHASASLGGGAEAVAQAGTQGLSPALSLSHTSLPSDLPREAMAAGLTGPIAVVLPDSRPGSAVAAAQAAGTAARPSAPCSLSPRDTAVLLATASNGTATTTSTTSTTTAVAVAAGLKRTASAASVTFTRNNVSVGPVSESVTQPVSVALVTNCACCNTNANNDNDNGSTPQVTASTAVPTVAAAGNESRESDGAPDSQLLSLKNLQAHMQRCGTLPVQDSVERHTRTILSCLPSLEAHGEAASATAITSAAVAAGPGSPTAMLARPPANTAVLSLGKSFSSSSYNNNNNNSGGNGNSCPLRACRFMSFDDVVDALEHTSEDELRAARARVRDSHRCACPDALLVPRQNSTLQANASLRSLNQSTSAATVTLVETLQLDEVGDWALRRATSFVGGSDAPCAGASPRGTRRVPQASSLQRNNSSGSYGTCHRSTLTGSAVRHTVCLAAAVAELSLQRSRHSDVTAVVVDEGRTMDCQAPHAAQPHDVSAATHAEQGARHGGDVLVVPVGEQEGQLTLQSATAAAHLDAAAETKGATLPHFTSSEALAQRSPRPDDGTSEAGTVVMTATMGWPGVTEGVDLLERKVCASHLFRIDAAQPARTPSPGALSANTSCEAATSQGVSSPTRHECHPPPHCWTGNDWSPCSDVTERGMTSGSSGRGLVASPQPAHSAHDANAARTPLTGCDSGALLFSSSTQTITTQPLHGSSLVQNGNCLCAARPTRVRQTYTYIEVAPLTPPPRHHTGATVDGAAPENTRAEATQCAGQELRCMRCVSLDDELYRVSDLERWARRHKRSTVSYATPSTDTEILT